MMGKMMKHGEKWMTNDEQLVVGFSGCRNM
jgi:hypothetical protein